MRPIPVTALGAALALACANPTNPFPEWLLDTDPDDSQRTEQTADLAPPARYVVQPGDTLYAIARWQNTSVEELMRVNALSDPDRLDVGQELVMPHGATPTGPGPIHLAPRRAARAPSPVPTTASAALLPLDCAILDTDESLRNARFEEALVDANKARSLLRGLDPQPGVAERRARVEMLSGMAEVALGRDEAARASFGRALDADPLLAVDPDTVSPKILRIFEEARTEPRQASR